MKSCMWKQKIRELSVKFRGFRGFDVEGRGKYVEPFGGFKSYICG